MKILFDISHPAHVHLYRNTCLELSLKGHDVIITTRESPAITDLLDNYEFEYTIIGKRKNKIFSKAIEIVRQVFRLYAICKNNKIEIGVSSGIIVPMVSKVRRKMISITLDDDDDDVEPFFVKFGHPLTNELLTPDSLVGKRKAKKTLFYPGLHELAYLHPNHFKPDNSVLNDLNLTENHTFFVLRFSAFNAHHDLKAEGISKFNKMQLVELLSNYGKVFITSEKEIEPELEEYRLSINPTKIHSLLYYSTLYIGDSQTMASEAAVLGSQSFRCNTFKGKIGYLEELEKKYGLTYAYFPQEFGEMMSDIQHRLQKISGLKLETLSSLNKLYLNKIDTSKFLVWFIHNYPNSKIELNSEEFHWESFKEKLN